MCFVYLRNFPVGCCDVPCICNAEFLGSRSLARFQDLLRFNNFVRLESQYVGYLKTKCP